MATKMTHGPQQPTKKRHLAGTGESGRRFRCAESSTRPENIPLEALALLVAG